MYISLHMHMTPTSNSTCKLQYLEAILGFHVTVNVNVKKEKFWIFRKNFKLNNVKSLTWFVILCRNFLIPTKRQVFFFKLIGKFLFGWVSIIYTAEVSLRLGIYYLYCRGFSSVGYLLSILQRFTIGFSSVGYLLSILQRFTIGF